MEKNDRSNNILYIAYAALTSLAITLFALVIKQLRRQSPARQEEDLALPEGVMPGAAVEQPPTSGTAVPQKNPRGQPGTSLTPTGFHAPEATPAPRWSTPTKYIMGVVLILAIILMLFIGRGVIPMVILAALLALFINPFVQIIHRKMRLKWGSAVALTYVLVILLLMLIPILLIPSLLNTINYLLDYNYTQLFRQIEQYLAALSASIQNETALKATIVPLLDSLIQALKNFSTTEPGQPVDVDVTFYSLSSQVAGGLGALAKFLGPVIAIVVSAIFTLLMALHMSLAANQISGWYPDLIPPEYKEEYASLIGKITKTWISFIRGQLTLMIIIGLMTWLGNLILGTPYALLLGIIAGLLELIPNIGPTLAAIPAVLLALIFGSSYLPVSNLIFALLVIGMYVLIQLIENQFIVPYVMGDAVNLPPLIVLIGTIAGATAFGILGALLATPIIATFDLLFRFVYRKILEPPPAPPGPEEQQSIWQSFKKWISRIRLPGQKKPAAG